MKALFTLFMMIAFFAIYPPVISFASIDPGFKRQQDSVSKLQVIAERLRQSADSQYNSNTKKMAEIDRKLLEVKIIEMEKGKSTFAKWNMQEDVESYVMTALYCVAGTARLSIDAAKRMGRSDNG